MVNGEPFFSIIVPVYNAEEYLKECLDSILQQPFKDYEVICVDDGSTDGSSVLLKKYIEKDSHFEIITQSNKGVAAARNAGLSKVRGKYILFCGADDYFEPDTFGAIYRALIKYRNPDFLRFDYFNLAFDSTSGEWGQGHSPIDYSVFDEEVHLGINLLQRAAKNAAENKNFLVMVWRHAVRRDPINTHHLLFNENIRYFEDIRFTIEELLLAEKTVIISDCLYNYRVHKNSIAHSDTPQHVVAWFQTLLSACMLSNERKEQWDKVPALSSYITKLVDQGQTRYLRLNEKQREEVHDILGDLLPSFQLIIEYPIIEKRDLNTWRAINGKYKKQTEKVESLEQEISVLEEINTRLLFINSHLENSLSYKIGRCITYIPRQVRDILRHFKQRLS